MSTVALPVDPTRTGGSVSLPTAAVARSGTIPARPDRELQRRLRPVFLLANVEAALRLAQPLTLGLAINDLLQQSYTGLSLFILQHLLHMLASALRQMAATRACAAVEAAESTHNLAAGIVDSPASHRLRARLDFLEHGLSLTVRSAWGALGSLAMLSWYDWRIVPLCLLLVVPTLLVHAAHGRRERLTSGLLSSLRRDRLVPGAGRSIPLSDSAAISFCLVDLFALALIAGALVQFCSTADAQAGDVVAVIGYLLLYVTGLDALPRLASVAVSLPRDEPLGWR